MRFCLLMRGLPIVISAAIHSSTVLTIASRVLSQRHLLGILSTQLSGSLTRTNYCRDLHMHQVNNDEERRSPPCKS